MMSSPSERTHRVYGVSFSEANFCASSSETSASLAICSGPAKAGPYVLRSFGRAKAGPYVLRSFGRAKAGPYVLALLADGHPPAQVRVHQLGVQFNRRIVFRCVFDLLEIVQPARLEDAVDDRNE